MKNTGPAMLAANAETSMAWRPPPMARAMKPVSTATNPPAIAAKKRNPMSEVPKNASSIRARKAVTGG
ncbi:MAG TPA: hypothetical protein VHZ52_02735 [Acidobacteriaceae bacterium]|nr:hypothetical protein [Acidobacteriaceae bacterium]